MYARDPKQTFKLIMVVGLMFLGAIACVPTNDVYVGLDKPGTTADGLAYDTNDIILYNTSSSTNNWQMFFDGEIFGLTDEDHDLSAFSFNDFIWLDLGPADVGPDAPVELEAYLSFEQNRARVPGIVPRVLGQDIVKLTATGEYTTTAGLVPDSYEYELFFDGSDVDLTKASEKLDGISFWPPEAYDFLTTDVEFPVDCQAGVLFLSTRGAYRVSTHIDGGFLVGDGSDVLAFCATNTGPATAGFWFRVFDGSDAGIQPRNAGFSLDVNAIGGLSIGEDSGDKALNMVFMFTPRKPFTAMGGTVTGIPSDLMVGEVNGGVDTVSGPEGNFNAGIAGPAVNGVVENIGLSDFPFSIP